MKSQVRGAGKTIPFRSQPQSAARAETEKAASSRFAPAAATVRRRLIVSIEGLEKDGKTHLALTAPGPIGYLGLDTGAEDVIPKFLGDDVPGLGGGPKPIDFADYRSPQEILLDSVDPQSAAKREWAAFEADYKSALISYRTVIVDTGSEMYELIRLAELGRLTQVPPNLYGPVNAKMRALIRLAYDHDANVIFLHKMKEEWVNEASFNVQKGKIENTSRRTGNYRRAGWNDMGYQVQVSVYAFREDQEGGGSNFYAKVLDCRHNPALNGVVLEGEQVNFPTLASMVMPGTSVEDWL